MLFLSVGWSGMHNLVWIVKSSIHSQISWSIPNLSIHYANICTDLCNLQYTSRCVHIRLLNLVLTFAFHIHQFGKTFWIQWYILNCPICYCFYFKLPDCSIWFTAQDLGLYTGLPNLGIYFHNPNTTPTTITPLPRPIMFYVLRLAAYEKNHKEKGRRRRHAVTREQMKAVFEAQTTISFHFSLF